MMTPADLQKSIKSNSIPDLVYLFGSERFFLDRTLQQITDAVVPEDARDFNFQVYHAKDNSIEAVLDSVRTLPVFSARRLVIVKDADKLSASDLESLLSYVEEPVPEY